MISPIEKVRARTKAAEILGVSPSASQREIRMAWRRAVRQLHPDRTTGDARRFMAAQSAFDLLSADWPEQAETAAAASLSAPRATRPVLQPRLNRFDERVTAACEELLQQAGGRSAADHVPERVARCGRELVYQVGTPLTKGVNRVALPTALLRDTRRLDPGILRFASPKEGAGEIVVPDSVREQMFPGARKVCIRFGTR